MKKCQHQPDERRLTEKLRGEARKITGPRKALLDLLTRESHPRTVKELYMLMPRGQCDLATVYRSMNMLERLGLVQRYDFGDGLARFELVRHSHQGHHHHLICTGCSKIVEIEDCFPVELEKRVARGNGFAAITHKLEFFGVCPKCQTG